MRYCHTQIGWVMIAALGGGIALVAVLMAVTEFNWVALAVLILLGVLLPLLATLTVTIDEEAVRAHFGPGVVRKTFPLKAVESCRVVKNRWYYGWGIRLAPDGWMFNVSGLHAVELHLKTGKRFRIGTDDPDGLAVALQQALEPSPG